VREFLQHYLDYLDWGLTDIILVSHDEKKVESGYNLEITTETVAARKTGFRRGSRAKESFIRTARRRLEQRKGF
jgi:hypothetical protein